MYFGGLGEVRNSDVEKFMTGFMAALEMSKPSFARKLESVVAQIIKERGWVPKESNSFGFRIVMWESGMTAAEYTNEYMTFYILACERLMQQESSSDSEN